MNEQQDIVVRLRDGRNVVADMVRVESLFLAAANEIERLRRELAEANERGERLEATVWHLQETS